MVGSENKFRERTRCVYKKPFEEIKKTTNCFNTWEFNKPTLAELLTRWPLTIGSGEVSDLKKSKLWLKTLRMFIDRQSRI